MQDSGERHSLIGIDYTPIYLYTGLIIRPCYNADQETRFHGLNANQKEYIRNAIASGLTKPRDIRLFLFNEIQCGLHIREPTMQQLYHFIYMEKQTKKLWAWK